MNRYFTLLIPILISLPVWAQQKNSDTNLVGDVKNKSTGEHVPFIVVAVKNTMIGTSTDATGHYFLKNLPEGKLVLQVSGVGYKSAEREVELKRGQTVELNFEVEEENLSLNEVVVSANRNEINRKEAAIVVGVLSPKLFQASNSVSLSQGLAFQPGVRVETDCQNCGFTQVRINGLEGPYSQILIDSRPIFSALSGVYGLEQIPVNMIERVEVVRGGGSALYGSNAIAGTINIITKEALSNSFTVSHNMEAIGGDGIDHNLSLNAGLVTDDNRGGLYVYGAYRNRPWYDHDGDGFSEIPLLKNNSMGFRSYYRLSNHGKLTLEYHHLDEHRRGGNKFGLQPHEADIAEQLDHDINGGGAAYNYISPNSKNRLNVYVSAQDVARQSYYGTGQDPDAYGQTNGFTAIGGAQWTHNFDYLWLLPAELTMGSEHQYDTMHDEMPGYDRNVKQTTRVTGFFAQNEWKGKRLSVLLGARLDKHNLLDDPMISPRANLKYNLTENMQWRGAYSSGFRAPQTFDEDLHISAVGGEAKLIRTADGLKAERSTSISTSVDWYKEMGRVQCNLLLEAFHTHIRDVFVLVEMGTDEQGNHIAERQNGHGATVAGINMEGRVMPTRNLQCQFGLTLQKSRYTQPQAWSDDDTVAPEKEMLKSPGQYGYFTLIWEPLRRLSLNATGTYTGKMKMPHFAGYIPNDRLERTPAFADMGLKASYEFLMGQSVGLQLSIGVKNLFDSYQSDFDRGPLRDAGYIYGPALPRTGFVSIKLSNVL
ncbi:MAG: TonB-dependent receptor [Breznakibacter sp.]